jgi:hypothetical protein
MSLQITQLPSPGRTDTQSAAARKQIGNAMPLLTLQIYFFHSIQTCRSCATKFSGLLVAEVDLCVADSPLYNPSGHQAARA